MNGLGLFADTDLLEASMFRNNYVRPYSKPWIGDGVLFRALYDRRLHAGMPQKDAMRVVPTIIAELVAGLNRAR